MKRGIMFYVALALLAANMAIFAYSAYVGFSDTSEGGEGASTLMMISALLGAYFLLTGVFALPIMLYKHASFVSISWVFFLTVWPIACVTGVLFGQGVRAHNWSTLALTALCPLAQIAWAARLLLK